jgi:alpha-galactosidase
MPTDRSLRARTRSLVAVLSALAVVLPATAALATAAVPAAATPVSAAPVPPVPAVDDGLALTPPMGFNNWNSTHCRAEFNEAMVKGIADIFVSRGLKDAGYQYVNLDDCWALPQRGPDGNLVPDPVRFPNGIKALADYVHARGLKFGIYTSAGTKTCNRLGFPGGLDHEQQDANLFASWGVDYLKYDNCNNQGRDAIERYTRMRDALKATGRPIVYSICEWGQNRPWEWAPGIGHLWRTTGDITDRWGSVRGIIQRNMTLARYAGPGHWNDPDMLEVGNGGMTDTEYRSHFSLWSIMAAPLLIGSDLREATPQTLEILLNREVIAVDQDRLGVQGTPIKTDNGRYVLVKPLANGDRAVALYNETDQPATIGTTAAEIGMPRAHAYRLRDLWAHTDRETAGIIRAHVPAHGTAMFRVSMDRRWPQYPPAVDLAIEPPLPHPGGTAVLTPGQTAVVRTTVTNAGRLPALLPKVDLTVAAPWTLRRTSPRVTAVLGTGRKLTTTWELTPHAALPPGKYELAGTLSYYAPGRARPIESAITTTVVLPPPAPRTTAHLGDLPWLTADNAFGPVERNTSNGEAGAGDGRPITIGGVVYPKGIGAHALSSVEFFVGGGCSSFRAYVGVDDSKGANGTVVFEVYADGRKVADSGVVTNAMPALPLTADITGATLLRLVVTDAGDGINSDHADWADATVVCA